MEGNSKAAAKILFPVHTYIYIAAKKYIYLVMYSLFTMCK